MNEPSDSELMESVSRGAFDPMTLIFARNRGELMGYFINMGASTIDAEDLVHEVFWRMLRYRKSYQSERPFKAWMFQIARNCHRDSFRNQSPAPANQEALANQKSAEDSPLESAMRASDHDILRAALNALPAPKREILVLARFHDLSTAALADLLKCREGAVKVRLHRALNALKQSYDQQLSNPTLSR